MSKIIVSIKVLGPAGKLGKSQLEAGLASQLVLGAPKLTTFVLSWSVKNITSSIYSVFNCQSKEESSEELITPHNNQPTIILSNACRHSDSREPAPPCLEVIETPSKIKYKYPNFLATFNANSLLKVRKVKHLT